MKQRHKHADVIVAWAEGEDVQVWDEDNNCWLDVKSYSSAPSFNERWEYRIKPPTKKYRVALFNGSTYTSTADTPEDAEFYEKAKGFARWLTDWVEYEG